MDSIDYSAKGTVFDIQRFSIHDGPGIRTIIFLKGCPLRCRWCSNPESQKYQPEVLYKKFLCIKCNNCIEACNEDAISPLNPYWIDRKKCTDCLDCAAVCTTGALIVKGEEMTVEDVIREAKKDATQYYRSGGGVTLSGGEALTQPNFAREIFKACRAQGWHTAIETEGYVNEEILRDVVPHIDLVLLDIKSIDTDQHKKYTDVDNAMILKSAKIIQSLTKTTVRVPVIPGFNATMKDITRIGEFVRSEMPNVTEIHLLGYHNYGQGKYELLGREYELLNTPKLAPEVLEGFKQKVETLGLKCIIGG